MGWWEVQPQPPSLSRGGGRPARLTQPHFAGVGEVVVAGHVAPLAPIVPHDDHAVLPGEEVAVGLPGVPVLIELGEQAGRGARGIPAHPLGVGVALHQHAPICSLLPVTFLSGMRSHLHAPWHGLGTPNLRVWLP